MSKDPSVEDPSVEGGARGRAALSARRKHLSERATRHLRAVVLSLTPGERVPTAASLAEEEDWLNRRLVGETLKALAVERLIERGAGPKAPWYRTAVESESERPPQLELSGLARTNLREASERLGVGERALKALVHGRLAEELDLPLPAALPEELEGYEKVGSDVTRGGPRLWLEWRRPEASHPRPPLVVAWTVPETNAVPVMLVRYVLSAAPDA